MCCDRLQKIMLVATSFTHAVISPLPVVACFVDPTGSDFKHRCVGAYECQPILRPPSRSGQEGHRSCACQSQPCVDAATKRAPSMQTFSAAVTKRVPSMRGGLEGAGKTALRIPGGPTQAPTTNHLLLPGRSEVQNVSPALIIYYQERTS